MDRQQLSIALAAFLLLPQARALAWNNVGHMTIAKRAYEELNDGQKLKALAILKKHPHYQMFLAKNRPEGVAEDEWVFMRASTWPDWVRSRDIVDEKGDPISKYNIGPDHYIDKPFILPGDEALFANASFEADAEHNILAAMTRRLNQLKTPDGLSEPDQAVALCWLLHLIGDVHQPLHCVSLFSRQFDDKNDKGSYVGDRGGNSFGVSIEGRTVKLHAYWDNLLGNPPRGFEDTPENLAKVYALVQQAAEKLHDPQFARDKFSALAKVAFADWVDEGAELARSAVYLKGDLKGVRLQNGMSSDAPAAPADYNDKATALAFRRVALAGYRLADKLGEALP